MSAPEMRVSTLWWSRNTPPRPDAESPSAMNTDPKPATKSAGDERQDARREERDDTTAERGEIREEVHVADAGAQREERRRVAQMHPESLA